MSSAETLGKPAPIGASQGVDPIAIVAVLALRSFSWLAASPRSVHMKLICDNQEREKERRESKTDRPPFSARRVLRRLPRSDSLSEACDFRHRVDTKRAIEWVGQSRSPDRKVLQVVAKSEERPHILRS